MLKHSLAIATCLAFSSSVMGNEANLLYTNTGDAANLLI